jgi:5-methylcytosine-specific restriction enzyme subunit McrC
LIATSSHQVPVYEIAEWKSCELKGASLSETDRRLAEELAAGETGRLRVEELRSGVRVSATSWVGVARFEQFEVRVVPKLTGGNLGLVEMIEFATGLDALRRNSGARTLATEGASLFDLVALLLAEGCERIARGGLLADYVEIEDELPTVRGRLLGDRQVLKKFGRVDRVICRFDELEQDVVENQILAAALEKCAQRVKDDAVRLRVGRLRSLFAEACSPKKLNPEDARQQLTYNRLNAHYKDAHALAWIVLDGLRALKDIYTPGRARSFAFLLDMNLLFERFVLRLFERLFGGDLYAVEYQRADRSIVWDANSNRPYSRVIPDLLLRTKHPPFYRLAVDAKYKLYDERKIAPGDVYQSFLYAYAYAQEKGESKSPPTSLIIYPSSSGAPGAVRLRVVNTNKMVGAEIYALGLPVPDCLRELRTSVLGHTVSPLQNIVARALGFNSAGH